ncbi:hypothetical protein M8J75_008064 [Diaphorina citri]|nr:hypothetical protein M8J75_008064 [Diaphorina citri]KAI5750985.1 hypothetical protein M8J77_003135 [Diaphorina citri]
MDMYAYAAPGPSTSAAGAQYYAPPPTYFHHQLPPPAPTPMSGNSMLSSHHYSMPAPSTPGSLHTSSPHSLNSPHPHTNPNPNPLTSPHVKRRSTCNISYIFAVTKNIDLEESLSPNHRSVWQRVQPFLTPQEHHK